MKTNWIKRITDAVADLITRTKGLDDIHDDLVTVDTVVDGIQTDLSNATDGLGALKTLIDGVETKVDTVDTVVDGIQTDLSNATDGLGALKALIDSAQGDITSIKTETDKLPSALHFKDQWCATPKATVALPAVAGDLDFSDVVFPTGFLPAGATVQAIYLLLKWRKQIDSSSAPNAVAAAGKTIRVMKDGATWGTNDIVALTLADDQLATDTDATEGGDMIISDTDVKAEVDDVDNETYNLRSEETNAGEGIIVDGASLTLHDVYTGMRVYFTLA